MDILLSNLPWMLINLLLAFLGVFFGFLFLNVKNKFFKIIYCILWILFIPNTIYLITDIQHIPEQLFNLNFLTQILLVAQYSILFVFGVITFIFGLRPLEKITSNIFIFILANFLIAFAIVLGKTQRTNSWDLLFNPTEVIESTSKLMSPTGIIYILIFGIICNVVYFGWRKMRPKRKKKITIFSAI